MALGNHAPSVTRLRCHGYPPPTRVRGPEAPMLLCAALAVARLHLHARPAIWGATTTDTTSLLGVLRGGEQLGQANDAYG